MISDGEKQARVLYLELSALGARFVCGTPKGGDRTRVGIRFSVSVDTEDTAEFWDRVEELEAYLVWLLLSSGTAGDDEAVLHEGRL